MSIQIPRPTDRALWLAARHPYFNASEAATLVHEHPFTTLARVVADKLAAEPVDRPETAAMRRGRHLEEAIASWWADEHGLTVYEPEVMYAREPFLATLDRAIIGAPGEALECKTTSGEIVEPERYWIHQVQAQCFAADLARVHIAAMDSTLSLKTFTIERDEEAIGRLVTPALIVMEHVRAGLWPPNVERPPRRTLTIPSARSMCICNNRGMGE